MQEQLFELGQRTPRLFIIQSKQILAAILVAGLIFLLGVLGSSAAERVTKLSCLQTQPAQFMCEIKFAGTCPQTGLFLGFVPDIFSPVEQGCVSYSVVLLEQFPDARIFFIAIGLGIVLWGWLKTVSHQESVP